VKQPVSALLSSTTRGVEGALGLLALFLGVFAISSSVGFQAALSPLVSGSSGGSDSSMVVSKRVNGLLPSDPALCTFSQAELESVRALPFMDRVEPVVSNSFEVRVEVAFADSRLSTLGFLEAMPEGAVPDLPKGFEWREGDSVVPLVIPRDFLTLYNMGFAASRGLPTASEEFLKSIDLGLEASGPGGRQGFKLKVVGLTSSVSTLLAPKSFLIWANSHIGSGDSGRPRRLVAFPKAGMGREAQDWARASDAKYDFSGGDQAAKGLAGALSAALRASLALGLVLVAVFACLMALMNRLFAMGNETAIRDLMAIGYASARIARVQSLRALSAQAVACALAALTAIALATALGPNAKGALGVELSGSIGPIALCALACLAALTAFQVLYSLVLVRRLGRPRA
jgi:hypothetical protein